MKRLKKDLKRRFQSLLLGKVLLRAKFFCASLSYSLVSAVLLLQLAGFSQNANAEVGLSNLEAAFIYQFTNYIDWPLQNPSTAKMTPTPTPSIGAGESNSKNPFVVCIVGNSPIAESLESIASAKSVHGRPIQIETDSELSSINQCQILFLPKSEQSQLDAVLKASQNKPILTVSEVSAAAESGFMIGFYVAEGKIRYAINRKVLEKNKFRVSSQLLKLAKIVGNENAK